MTKAMKFIFAGILIFSLSACNEENETTTDDLVGLWTAQSFSFDVETSTTVNGTETIITTTGTGSNMNYDLEFTESTFTTSGGYSYSIISELDGSVITDTDQTVSNVSGSGTYSTSGDVMTIDGSFFELTANGIDLTAVQGEQMTNYEIMSDGSLVFSQDEEITSTQQGVTTTSKVTSTSVWIKQ